MYDPHKSISTILGHRSHIRALRYPWLRLLLHKGHAKASTGIATSQQALRHLCGKQPGLILRCSELLQQTTLATAQGWRSPIMSDALKRAVTIHNGRGHGPLIQGLKLPSRLV